MQRESEAKRSSGDEITSSKRPALDGEFHSPSPADRAREGGGHVSSMVEVSQATVQIDGELVIVGSPPKAIIHAVDSQLHAVISPNFSAVRYQDVVESLHGEVQSVRRPAASQDHARVARGGHTPEIHCISGQYIQADCRRRMPLAQVSI